MAGRPPKQFSEKDIEQMKALARCHCTDEEIAAFMGCGEMTLKRHFGPLLKEFRKSGQANLRAKQYQLAMGGNVPLLIWLGKQLLGQRENAFDKRMEDEAKENESLSKESTAKLLQIVRGREEKKA